MGVLFYYLDLGYLRVAYAEVNVASAQEGQPPADLLEAWAALFCAPVFTELKYLSTFAIMNRF